MDLNKAFSIFWLVFGIVGFVSGHSEQGLICLAICNLYACAIQILSAIENANKKQGLNNNKSK